MVGIYNKIKNGLNWLKGKALKYVAPVVGKLGDFAQSDFAQGLAGIGTPILDSLVPGLGTGINTGLNWLGKAGNIANGLAEDYAEQGDDFGYVDAIKNVTSGKYNKKGGIALAKRPDGLHPRVELKALPPPDDDETVSNGYASAGNVVASGIVEEFED